MSPAVGITSSDPFAADGVPGPGVLPYVRAVERSGARAMLFRNDLASLDEQLAGVDGVVLSGGVDIAIARYGGHDWPEVEEPRAERDAFEIELAHVLRQRSIPVLCVCRGLQLVNVAFGGTLIEDLPRELGTRYTLHHQQVHEDGQDRNDVAPEHVVHVAPDSALARLAGSSSFATNSMHHQAVRTVAPGLRAVAWTPDGVIEALDAEFSHPFFYAVQWHPEELPHERASARLFDGLTRAARQTALERA